ncbi:hypothetical protein [Methylopila sp. 73B]|uniref:hypothetical protein n=1 Tax=Methylopila sp. 73B TaxID=1120792 RepID=UPI00036B337F|nr:hypothetical protein [Methylopila sp. 73B]
MLSFKERMLQEARLVMVRELGRQTSGRLPVRAFEAVLEVEGHTEHSPEWIMTQLAFLEQIGVVRRIKVGESETATIAQLTDLGERFLKRRVEIAGIKRPDFDVEI